MEHLVGLAFFCGVRASRQSKDVRRRIDGGRDQAIRASSQAKALLEHLQQEGHCHESVPVLLGGDFNCPSHLDWTKDTSGCLHVGERWTCP